MEEVLTLRELVAFFAFDRDFLFVDVLIGVVRRIECVLGSTFVMSVLEVEEFLEIRFAEGIFAASSLEGVGERGDRLLLE